MKKFYSFLAAVCVLFMVGCSDDDEKKQTSINKTYKDVTISFNKFEQEGKTVTFKSDDLINGTVTINSLLPGESQTVVDVTLTETSKINEYTFEGNIMEEDMEEDVVVLTVKGTVGKELDIDITYKETSNIVKKWRSMGLLQKSTVGLKITNDNEDATINLHGILQTNEIKLSQLPARITIADGIVFTTLLELGINLQENGFLVANWEPKSLGTGLINPGQSEDGVVLYNHIDNKIVVKLPFGNLFAGASRDTSPLPGLLNGEIAFNIDNVDEKALAVSIDLCEIDSTVLLVLKGMLPSLLANLEIGEAGATYGLTSESLTGFLTELIDAIRASNEFIIQINLRPAA